MKTIKLHLKAEEPLVITDGSSEGMSHETLNYIPGSMLLGAFASIWVKNNANINPDESSEFNDLFLNGKVKWGNAYPSVWNKLKELETVPIPLTFQKIKNYAGLPEAKTSITEEEQDKEDRRVLNLIRIDPNNTKTLRDYCSEQLNWKFGTKEAAKPKKIDGGFMSIDGCCQPNIRFGFNTHVAMDEFRHGADHQLFGYSSINAGTTFVSEVMFDDEIADELKVLLSKGDDIRVGHSRSAGYGRLSYIKEAEKIFSDNEVDLAKSKEIYLFLSSSYIPKHSWEKPIKSLERELISSGLGENCVSASDVSCRYKTISGYSGKWHLPRPSRNAIVAGSVIKLNLNTNENVKLPPALGADTAEGYGRYLINPTFLDKLSPELKCFSKSEQVNSNLKMNNPLSILLKKRGMARLCDQKVFELLEKDIFENFIKSVKGSLVTASQRGNLRQKVSTCSLEECKLWFDEVLSKSSSSKWSGSDAVWECNEQNIPNYHESLDKIMKELLDPNSFKKFVPKIEQGEIIGNLTETDQKEFEALFHKRFLLELLNAWGKSEVNSGGED